MKHGFFIGLMSGTSLDGIDAALVDFSDDSTRLKATSSMPWPESVATRMKELIFYRNNALDELCELNQICATLFAEATQQLLKKTAIPASDILAIGSHGQTIRHQPDGSYGYSLQIGDPNRLAELTGITTVADFRQRDIAAGGQGAPLVPAFHARCFAKDNENRVILNLGGIANITILDQQKVRGFDTGPANRLLDDWTQENWNRAYDKGGELASSGSVDHELLEQFMTDPYFSRKAPKSTGSDYFNPEWIKKFSRALEIPQNDVLATLCQLSARTIIHAIEEEAPETRRLLVCGGGIHNKTLIRMIQDFVPEIPVESTGVYGYEPDWIEAMTFAWLAKRTLERQSGNLPSVTGARHPVILGGIYQAGM